MTVLILDARVIYDLALNRKQTYEGVVRIINWLSDDYELKVSSLVKNHLKGLLGDDEAKKYISAFSDSFFEINSELLRIIKDIAVDDSYSSIEAAYAKTRRDAFIVTTCPDSFKGSEVYVCGDTHLQSLQEKLALEKIYLLKYIEPLQEEQSLVEVGTSSYQNEAYTHTEPKSLKHIKVISTNIPSLTFEQNIDLLIDWATNNLSKYACVADIRMLMEAYWHQPFSQVLQNADMVTPNGMPLVWIMRFLGCKGQDRVSGMDILKSLCHKASEENVKVFFLGSQQSILDLMRARLDKEYPNLNVAAMKPLPFHPLTQAEDEALIEEIHETGAGIVFLSLGCPRQEKWMAEHQGKVEAVMIGLGVTFPTYAGLKKWAPRWVRQSGLEWLYHLVQEPKRLMGRYAQKIPPFIFLAFTQLFSEFAINKKFK